MRVLVFVRPRGNSRHGSEVVHLILAGASDDPDSVTMGDVYLSLFRIFEMDPWP